MAFHGGLDAWLRILLAVAAVFLMGASSTAVVIGYTCASLVVTVSQLAFLRRTIPAGRSAERHELEEPDVALLVAVPGMGWLYLDAAGFGSMGPRDICQHWKRSGGTQFSLTRICSHRPGHEFAMTFLGPILYSRCGDATDNTRNAHVHRLSWLMTYISLLLTVAVFFITYVIHEPLFQLLAAARYGEVSLMVAMGRYGRWPLRCRTDAGLEAHDGNEVSPARCGQDWHGRPRTGINICGAAVAGIPGVVVSLLAFSIIYFAWMVWLAAAHRSQPKLQNENTDDRVATVPAF